MTPFKVPFLVGLVGSERINLGCLPGRLRLLRALKLLELLGRFL
jgi:hypothetical protein